MPSILMYHSFRFKVMKYNFEEREIMLRIVCETSGLNLLFLLFVIIRAEWVKTEITDSNQQFS